jgi:hypothetical protein
LAQKKILDRDFVLWGQILALQNQKGLEILGPGDF